MWTSPVILFMAATLLVSAQKPHSKGTPELMQPMIYETDNSEILTKISAQLMDALALIENMQEGTPIKIAEKRRNKFEFIRFGRK